jgi:hypothetical protein
VSPGEVLGGMTLGELIAALERIGPAAHVTVAVDRIKSRPKEPRSYRGFYEDLALGFEPGSRPASELLAELRAALGQTLDGYKGGGYRATEATGLWASNWGDASGLLITGVAIASNGDAMILTKRTDH